jgi:hypothetical protein
MSMQNKVLSIKYKIQATTENSINNSSHANVLVAVPALFILWHVYLLLGNDRE